VYRYRCRRCWRTFRHYPVGIDRARKQCGCGLWQLWLDLGDELPRLISLSQCAEIGLSRMSIWRDVQRRAEQLERERFWKPVRVLGIDGAYVRGWGKTQPVLVAVDLGRGEPLMVGYVDEKNP
jgi:hypothetical protein